MVIGVVSGIRRPTALGRPNNWECTPLVGSYFGTLSIGSVEGNKDLIIISIITFMISS